MMNNLQKKYTAFLGFFLILFCFFIPTMFVFAADARQPYVPLAPLPDMNCPPAPGTQNPNCDPNKLNTDLGSYVSGAFRLAIAISGVLAVMMIVFAGIKYMSADAIGSKSEARKQIQDAILGLLLVFASYIILEAINPDLVNFNVNLDPVPLLNEPKAQAPLPAGDNSLLANVNKVSSLRREMEDGAAAYELMAYEAQASGDSAQAEVYFNKQKELLAEAKLLSTEFVARTNIRGLTTIGIDKARNGGDYTSVLQQIEGERNKITDKTSIEYQRLNEDYKKAIILINAAIKPKP